MSTSEAREVPIEEAMTEAKGIEADIDQEGDGQVRSAPPRPGPQISEEEKEVKDKLEEDLELLAPKVAPHTWTFGPEDSQRTYIQYELSVTGSARWFGLVGEVLEQALSGEHALSLNSLLAAPAPRQPGRYTMQDFQDADTFVHALGKLLQLSPAFLEKSVCIWLSVPDYEWDLVSELMKLPPSQGGMSHDMFEEILATFLDQNYPEIDRFFRVRYPRLRDRYRARAKEAGRSRSSKR